MSNQQHHGKALHISKPLVMVSLKTDSANS